MLFRSLTPKESTQAPPDATVALATQQAVLGVTQDDGGESTTRGRLPDLMSMSFEEVVLSFFPSISELLLPALRLKMMSAQTDNENPRWHINYILELMAKFPVMQRDLNTSGVSYVNAANTILARAQQETSQSIAARAGRGRGETNSVVQESAVQTASPLTPEDSIPASERITLDKIGEMPSDVHERATVNPGDIIDDVQARSQAITLPGEDSK